MGSRVSAFLMLLFLSSAAVLLCSQVAAVKADASIVRVPEDFPTIQEAINAAQNGSTIIVSSGVYYEHLTINKTLTLMGAEKEDVIVDGSGSGDVIAVAADNVLIDGFTVRNSSLITSGIRLENSFNSTIKGNIVTMNGGWGIGLDDSRFNTVSDNIVSFTEGLPISSGLATGTGIAIGYSTNNTISDNVITSSSISGLAVEASENNMIFDNVIQDNPHAQGIFIAASSGNTVFHNSLINNQEQIEDVPNGTIPNVNIWDRSGQGNYWADYNGLDDGSGGRVASDGVGDTDLPWHGVDNFPLISPVNPIRVFWNNTIFPAFFISNSTVEAFSFDQTGRRMTFNVIGPANTTGYFNLSTPAALLSGPWTVLLDGHDVTSEAAITENQTYTTIYLNYSHSAHSVQIIGTNVVHEYSTVCTILFSVFLATPATILIAKKRKKNRQT